MKTILLSLLVAALSAPVLQAQKPSQPPNPSPPPKDPPPPVLVAPTPAPPKQTFIYDQKPLANRPYLVAPEQAQDIIDRFKETYEQLGKPRLLIFVNRELVDQTSGLKLSARRQEATARRGEAPSEPAETVTTKNYYRNNERGTATLADRQTVRDVERLFGRPLRMAGARLADQRVATQLIADRSLGSFAVPTEGEQARKDREALAKIADVVLEILISSRDVVVTEISGDKAYSVPDIQATAIRLEDSRILGQATSSDIVGPDRQAGRVLRHSNVREITEATALSLMEDMVTVSSQN